MEFNHFDENGNAIMVDVSEKKDTERVALAKGRIYMSQETISAVRKGSVKKGDVLGVARVAGIMAAKRTPDLIPLCHVLCLTKAAVDFTVEDAYVEAVCTVKTTGKTGVEMEALTGVSTALLTIFDMCKALDKTMEITDIHVVRKEGGKSGLFLNPKDAAGECGMDESGRSMDESECSVEESECSVEESECSIEESECSVEESECSMDENAPIRVAVVTLSDKGAAGEREDLSGPAIAEMVTEFGYKVIETVIIPDERKRIESELVRLADSRHADLILTTGGTGFSKRDVTPEATRNVATRLVPGIAEAMRQLSMKYTKRAMLSRAASVLRNDTLIINMPGSPKAVRECLEEILDSVDHGLKILKARESECARK